MSDGGIDMRYLRAVAPPEFELIRSVHSMFSVLDKALAAVGAVPNQLTGLAMGARR